MQEFLLAKDLRLLVSQLAPKEKGQKRSDSEREAISKLLEKHFGAPVEVAHYPSGKPYLSSHQELSISISHSDKDVAVLLSPSNFTLGLDIEDLAEQVFRVRHKYLDQEEEEVIISCQDETLALHFAWSAKESLYKALNPEEPYLANFKLVDIKLGQSKQTAELSISYQKTIYQLKGFYTSDYVLSYIALG